VGGSAPVLGSSIWMNVSESGHGSDPVLSELASILSRVIPSLIPYLLGIK